MNTCNTNSISSSFKNIVKSDVQDFVENDYVHKTGTETITGDKTFGNTNTNNATIDTENSTTSNITTANITTANVGTANITNAEVSTSAKFGDVSGGNYSEFENDGSLIKNGNATTWTDFTVSATSTKIGSNLKPVFDYTNIGLLFPQNDTSEKVYLCFQMDHRKKLDSNISFHLHYIQTSATQPTFTMEYKFYNNGGNVPGSWTTLNTSDIGGSKGLFTYTSGSMLQIAKFPVITPPTNETVSANLDVILYRNDNDLTGTSLVKYIDFHYEIDSDGSRQEYIK